MSREEKEAPLEAPDNLGRPPRAAHRDWRREDRERLRSARTAGQLMAVVLVPLTLIAFALTASGVITPSPEWVIFGILLVAAIVIWFLGVRFRQPLRSGGTDPQKR